MPRKSEKKRDPTPPQLIREMARVSEALLQRLREEMKSDSRKRRHLDDSYEDLCTAHVYIKRAVEKLKR